MRVLIACEESQTVCKAFRARGHEAYSCDIEECSGGHPEWHIYGDVSSLLTSNWDIVIAHPPCTYLSNAGARFLYPKGVLNKERYERGLKAREFFMLFYALRNRCRLCIENPTPSKVFNLPPHTQTIQPYYFGHPVKKKTNLWLYNLPKLVPTQIVEGQSTKVAGNWFNKGGKDRQKNRSKTFQGIADAMADQWGSL